MSIEKACNYYDEDNQCSYASSKSECLGAGDCDVFKMDECPSAASPWIYDVTKLPKDEKVMVLLR